jgi:multiple sugar transport system substrate-binding protein
MRDFTRRDALTLGAITGAGLLGSARPASAAIPVADVAPPHQPIEAGATLRVIRPSKFVDPDETVWNENTQKFV